jgi:hypothetical protein
MTTNGANIATAMKVVARSPREIGRPNRDKKDAEASFAAPDSLSFAMTSSKAMPHGEVKAARAARRFGSFLTPDNCGGVFCRSAFQGAEIQERIWLSVLPPCEQCIMSGAPSCRCEPQEGG